MPPLPTVDPTPVVFWGLTQKALFTAFAPAVLTGLLALLGAWVGFHLANRGRKYDIFYKERYKGFEELAGYMYAIVNKIRAFHIALDDGISKGYFTERQAFVEFTGNLTNSLVKLEEPNNRYTSLLSEKSRNLYALFIVAVEDMAVLLFEIEKNKEGILSDESLLDKYEQEFRELTKSVEDYKEQSLKSMLKDLSLPKR